MGSKASEETLRAAYLETCKSYHTVRESQLKLIGVIPVISGTAASLLLKEDITAKHLPVIGVLGAFITLGLFIHGLRAAGHADALIALGKWQENELNLEEGQFLKRPPMTFGFVGYMASLIWVNVVLLLAWVYIIIVGLIS